MSNAQRFHGISGFFLFWGSLAVHAQPPQVGLIPVPTLGNVSIDVAVQYDPSKGDYDFTYTLRNPASSTGSIRRVDIDNSVQGDTFYDPYRDQRSLSGWPTGNRSFVDEARSFTAMPLHMRLRHRSLSANLRDGSIFVPIDARAPDDWLASLSVSATLGFGVLEDSALLAPGSTLPGFGITSQGIPTFRNFLIEPNWIYAEAEDDGEEELALAAQVESQIMVSLKSLAPSWVVPGSIDHLNQLRSDIDTAVGLSWITDATLASKLQSQLAPVRAKFLQNYDLGLAVSDLEAMQATIAASEASQRSGAAYDLLRHNVAALLALAREQVPLPPPEPAVVITRPAPPQITQPLNTPVTVTATVQDKANNYAPLSGRRVELMVADGPNAGLRKVGRADSAGQVSLIYTGTEPGLDLVLAGLDSEVLNPQDAAAINWEGGPDLVISFFTPEILRWDGTREILISEITRNAGTLDAGPSVTRYFISSSEPPVDPATALAIGSRQVPALNPREESRAEPLWLKLPAELDAGRYYLTACADSDKVVPESNETNNCGADQVAMAATFVEQMPPDCSKATPSRALWPPNHKFVDVGIVGVKSTAGDAVAIKITSIFQDEPIQVKGSGSTEPDGKGIGTAIAQVRAERAGGGDGRLYFIGFQASSGGGSCSGSVTVGVPHDQGQGKMPADSGQRYDSTVAPGKASKK